MWPWLKVLHNSGLAKMVTETQNLAENKVLSSLASEKYAFRSAKGLAEDAGITIDEVIVVLKRFYKAGTIIPQTNDASFWGLSSKHPEKAEKHQPVHDNREMPDSWWQGAYPKPPFTPFNTYNGHVDYKQADEAKIRAFAADLAEVMEKHNAVLGGCNCCSSPYGQVDGVTFENLRVTKDSYIFRIGRHDYTASVQYGDVAAKTLKPPKDVTPHQQSTLHSHMSLVSKIVKCGDKI